MQFFEMSDISDDEVSSSDLGNCDPGGRQQEEKAFSSWNIRASDFCRRTYNPIRATVEQMNLVPNPDKEMIALSIGDPTVFGNLVPAPEVVDSVVDAVKSMKFNGYAPSAGFAEARESVARQYNHHKAPITAEDVLLCSGCSSSLDLSISVLGNPGQNILVPKPGFPLYKTLAHSYGIETKFYHLLPDRNWEIDLDQMESQIDQNTCCIVVNNPSNPCGSVYTESHLTKVLDIAARHLIPVIADEIYDSFVFPKKKFYPLSSLTDRVPILTCGGLAKKWLVPGWRMGWIIIHDRNDSFKSEIRPGLQSLSQRLIGASTVIQGALPMIFERTKPEFYKNCIEQVQENAEIAQQMLSRIPGLKPVLPEGSMYMMVGMEMDRFEGFSSDLHFVERLVAEQSVFCLPGMCFDYPNYVRLVLTVPKNLLQVACIRIEDFCRKHYKSCDVSNITESGELEGTAVVTSHIGNGKMILSDENGNDVEVSCVQQQRHNSFEMMSQMESTTHKSDGQGDHDHPKYDQNGNLVRRRESSNDSVGGIYMPRRKSHKELGHCSIAKKILSLSKLFSVKS